MHDYDIAIVGGGMVGLTLANLLANSGLSIAVLDVQPPRVKITDDDRLRVSALSRASQTILNTVHCWTDEVQAQSCAYDSMTVWDDLSSGHLHFDAASLGEPDIGHIVPNADLRLALWQRLVDEPNVNLMAPIKLDTAYWHQDGVDISLDNNDVVKVRLAVAADGANSWLRQQAGVAMHEASYDHVALVASIATTKVHGHCARQVFLDSGPLAFLPLKNDHQCSIVWSAEPGKIAQLVELPDTEFEQALSNAFGNHLGKLTLLSKRMTFPLIGRHTEEYVRDGLALVGDAAHTIHPLAGQGANLGILDAATLANTIQTALGKQLNWSSRQCLRPYERWRRSENQLMLDAMRALKSVFGEHHSWFMSARGLGMNLINQTPMVKNRLIRHAMGLDGDLPELAKPPIPDI